MRFLILAGAMLCVELCGAAEPDPQFKGDRQLGAAAFKLSGNLFLMFLTTGMIEMISFARTVGIAPADAVTLFESFNPGQTLHARAKRILDAAYDKPSWELAMARKDARLMLEESERHGVPLPMLPAIAATMDRFLERGHAHDDWTVIAKDALER